MKNFYKIITLFLTLLFTGLTLIQPIQMSHNIEEAKAWDVATHVACNWLGEDGKKVAKVIFTDYWRHATLSKSSTNESDHTSTNWLNQLLKFSGYEIGSKSASDPFTKFGLAGLKFTSYTGEWKYYKVDPCEPDENQTPTSTNFGEFYEGRKDPLTTFAERHAATDIRTIEFNRDGGYIRLVAIHKALWDNISNVFLTLSKIIVALLLSLVSVAMSDLANTIGIGKDIQVNMVTRLYKGLFLPLLTMAWLGSGIYILYFGIIKRQYRQSLIGGIIKPLLATILGIVIGVRPELAQLPSKLSVMIQAVVVGAMTEHISGDGSTNLCEVSKSNTIVPNKKNRQTRVTDTVKGGIDEEQSELNNQSDLMKQAIGCRIWAEYLFKPFVIGQFGEAYDKLEKLDNKNAEWVKEPEVKLGKKTIKNWGLLQVSSMSGNHTPIDGLFTANVNGVSKDWYRIVDALSNYDDEIEGQINGGSNGSGGSGGKAGTSPNAEAFIKEFGEAAKKIGDESGLYASIILAQAALESGWGSSLSGTYNYFGIKCFGNDCSGPLTTQEDYGGGPTTIKDSFKNFKSAEDGFEGYAHFILGRGAGANFTGSMKKNASSPEEAITAIKNAGYATAKDYVSNIMSIINQYDLTRFDTKNKEPKNPSKYPIEWGGGAANSGGSGGSGGSSGSSDGKTRYIFKQKYYPPLKQWDYWVGNHQGHRLGYSLILIFMTILGSIGPLAFALLTSVYSLGLTILCMLAPAFLIFGAWGGKGNSILMQYIGSIVATFMKKIVCSVLLVLSIIISTATLQMLNEVGFMKALLFMTICTFALYKNKDKVLEKISQINLPQLNTAPAANIGKKAAQMGTTATKYTGKLSASAIVGGIGAKKNHGSFKEGAKAALKNTIKNDLMRSKYGRLSDRTLRSMQAEDREKVRKEHLDNEWKRATGQELDNNNSEFNNQIQEEKHICVVCGTEISGGEQYYMDEYGNVYCSTCASLQDNYTDLDSFVHQEEDNYIPNQKHKMTGKDGKVITYKNQDGEYVTQKVTHFDQKNLRYSTNIEEDFNGNREVLKQRIKESLALVQNDINIANEENIPLAEAFIPNTLYGFVNPYDLQTAIMYKNYDSYKSIMTDGWRKWYKTQAERYSKLSENDLNNDLNELGENILE